MHLPSPEQLAPLFRWLRYQQLCWLYIPVRHNDESGIPQVLIFDTPSRAPLGHIATAVMFRYRPRGKGPYQVSPAQAHWVGELIDRGWEVLMCRNARTAIRHLKRMGYGARELVRS